MSDTNATYKFEGFTAPRYTQIPDVVFDELAPILTGAEYKILMYMLRRTFGFKKDFDSISYSQILKGIVTKAGQRLDYGAGVKSSRTVAKSIKRLEELNIIVTIKNSSNKRGNEATTYVPNMGGEVLSPSTKNGLPPTAKSKVGARAKSKVPPTAKSKETRNSNNKKQTTTTNSNGTGENSEQAKSSVLATPVVAFSLLKNQGIGSNQFEGIIQSAQKAIDEGVAGGEAVPVEDYIGEKIAYRDFLIETRPDVVKNKIAWLISAIKNDYAEPDGYKSKEQIEADRQAEAKRLEESEAKQRAYQQEQIELGNQQKQIQAKALERAYTQWQTPEAIKTEWRESIESERYSLPSHQKNVVGRNLDEVYYLGHDDNKIYIFAPSSSVATVRNYLTRSVYGAFKNLSIDKPNRIIPIELITENSI